MSWLFNEAPSCDRFVAVHPDGDAVLFLWDDDGYFFTCEGGFVDDDKPRSRAELVEWLKGCGYICWQALPEDYRFKWEVQS